MHIRLAMFCEWSLGCKMSEDQTPGDFFFYFTPDRSVSLRALIVKKKMEGEYPTRQAISDLKYDQLRYVIQLR
jgi:hypothetical protein